MQKRNLLFVLLVMMIASALIAVACGGGETTVTQTVTQTETGSQSNITVTQTVTSTVTATPAPAPEIAIGEADNGKQVICNAGDVLRITLTSNPSTGYGWELVDKSLDYNVLQQVGEAQFEPGSGALGAPGKEILRFKAIGPGLASINLAYTAPFESRPPSQTFSVQIDVAAGWESNGKQVAAKIGQVLRVRLPGNPSTGYTWEAVDLDTSLLQQVGEAKFEAGSSLPGAPGYLTMQFQTLREGRSNLKVVYHRPWETSVPPVDTFSIQVTILGVTATVLPTASPTAQSGQ